MTTTPTPLPVGRRALVALATLVVLAALLVGINIDHEWGASYHDSAADQGR